MKPLHLNPGQRFGRWVVLQFSHKVGWNKYYLCRCDCGTTRPVYQHNLTRGLSHSCGCLSAEAMAKRTATHGLSKTSEYGIWNAMLGRCHNPKHISFNNYGARGICVCERWGSFENFIHDMGRKPSPTHTIERKNTNGNYEPSNCRWATPLEQGCNKRNNRWLTFLGKTQTVAQWAREIGITPEHIRARIDNYGWSVERALSEPLHPNKRRTKKDHE